MLNKDFFWEKRKSVLARWKFWLPLLGGEAQADLISICLMKNDTTTDTDNKNKNLKGKKFNAFVGLNFFA
ncbi:MAG: hypothetical protein H5U06_07640 [Candidatus Aminicenantes bacterium]|nr:hypothetical protein [Candidatus Aminicenantes bacterium]